MLKSRIALAMTAAVLVLPAAAQAAGTDTYIVQLDAAPLATYHGGTRGIPGTSPRVTGRKLKPDSAPGLDYRAYLASRQDALLGRVRGASPRVVYNYRFALGGFAAEMTSAQAEALKGQAGVKGVWKSQLEHVMDAGPDARLGGERGEGPAYLRLSAPVTGLWDRLGGPLSANGAGAGVIVGDIDTGIQPGHPSFADKPGPTTYEGDPFTQPAVWDGTCQTGPGFPDGSCNAKLIGARYYDAGFGEANLAPGSFVSPRDDDGHGTHTASTAAGNYGVDPAILGNDLGVDVISGIAPRAYVAAYKVCWNGSGAARPTGCASADVVKAIDQAVADGVDVINMSLGSDTSALFGPQEASLLNAAAAGVFVANSAGNAGPGAGTVGAPSSVPWTTAVAADTTYRSFVSTVTIHGASDFTVTGASVTGALPASPLVDGAAAGLPGQAADAALCKPQSLDPAQVAGKVVLCLRGDNDRIDKSRQVSLAGGAGMILYNSADAQELGTDTHWVPTAHVTRADGLRIKAAIAPGATAALSAGQADRNGTPRVLAAFSSRGPQLASPDIPKPDLTAPGVQVLGGAADQPAPISEERPGQLFGVMQGTSMAAPQVAGAAALLTQVAPTLSPAEIKSELMLTANPDVKKEDDTTPATPFDAGSGEIDPTAAARAGLVLDTTLDDYVQYLECMDPTIVAGDIARKQPTDLNLAAISFSRFAGKDSTTRTFRSIDPTATVWNVALQAPPGTTGTVNVPSFEVRPGQTRALTVSLTRTTAPLDQYTFGALVLTSGNRTLRLPISVKPVFAAVPSPVSASTANSSGRTPVKVRPGFAGPLSGLGYGLAAPHVDAGRRITATTKRRDLSGTDPGTQLYPVTVPSGSQLVSARLSNVDAGTDLDLFLLRDPNADGDYTDAELVGSSTRSDSAERIDVPFPQGGSYVIAVVAFNTAAAGSLYDLSSWVVDDDAPDDPSTAPALAVTGDPVTATPGDPTTLSLQWSGVTGKGLYLGVVTYQGPEAPARGAFSIVEVTKTADDSAAGGGGAVPTALELRLPEQPASFGTFMPTVERSYDATLAATVTSTAGDATLSVSDPSTVSPGHLVNGAFALPSPLRARATNAAHPDQAYVPLAATTGTPTRLLSWTAPTNTDPVTIGFRQAIGARNVLRAGTYAKTLTFTLSTNTP